MYLLVVRAGVNCWNVPTGASCHFIFVLSGFLAQCRCVFRAEDGSSDTRIAIVAFVTDGSLVVSHGRDGR